MKIKKPATTQSAAGAPAGGAALADRFKLNVQPVAPVVSAKNGTISKKAALVALIASGFSLAIAGILTFLLYQHWQYLMPA